MLFLSADGGKKKVAKKKGSSFQTVSALFRVRNIQVYLPVAGLSHRTMSNVEILSLCMQEQYVVLTGWLSLGEAERWFGDTYTWGPPDGGAGLRHHFVLELAVSAGLGGESPAGTSRHVWRAQAGAPHSPSGAGYTSWVNSRSEGLFYCVSGSLWHKGLSYRFINLLSMPLATRLLKEWVK